MERKNPLEEIREVILESRLFGVENEITQMGVSDELLTISDALDFYYDIKRGQEPDTIEMMDGVYKIKTSPYISSLVNSPLGESRFAKTKRLLKQVKEPLMSMRNKLSENDPTYLNLSSAIVSIALRNVVSAVNAYKAPDYNDYRRYNHFTGIDNEFCKLIFSGLKIFNELNDFDMTTKCFDNYESNRKAILSMAENLRDLTLHPRSSSSVKSSSSGCMVLTLAISTAFAFCFCLIVNVFFC